MSELQFLQCCSANYLRLYQLLEHERKVGDIFSWRLEPDGIFQLHIQGRSTYTEIIRVQHDIPHNVSWLKSFTLRLCLYHDVRLAEICDQPLNEKATANHLLCEALSFIRQTT